MNYLITRPYFPSKICLFGFLRSSSTTRLYGRQVPRLRSDNFMCCHTRHRDRRDHDFCLSQSHYTDTIPTSREQAATAVIKPKTSLPRAARSIDWATTRPSSKKKTSRFCTYFSPFMVAFSIMPHQSAQLFKWHKTRYGHYLLLLLEGTKPIHLLKAT